MLFGPFSSTAKYIRMQKVKDCTFDVDNIAVCRRDKSFQRIVLKMTEIARNKQREIHQTDCGKIRNRDSHSVNSRRMREISVVTIISPAHGHGNCVVQNGAFV